MKQSTQLQQLLQQTDHDIASAAVALQIATTSSVVELRNEAGIFAINEDGSHAVWLHKPISCAVCGTMTALFINRDGTTRCCSCDQKVKS